MHFHSLATPGCWTRQPSPSCSTSSSCLLITCGVYMELPHPAPSLCTMSGLYPSKKLKTKPFLKAGKCTSWVWAHCPYCSLMLRTKDFFSLWGQYFPLSATPSEAAEDNQTILCWGTCPARQLLSFQSSNFTPKLPTLVLNCYQLELWTSDLISEWTYVTNRKK